MSHDIYDDIIASSFLVLLDHFDTFNKLYILVSNAEIDMFYVCRNRNSIFCLCVCVCAGLYDDTQDIQMHDCVDCAIGDWLSFDIYKHKYIFLMHEICICTRVVSIACLHVCVRACAGACVFISVEYHQQQSHTHFQVEN